MSKGVGNPERRAKSRENQKAFWTEKKMKNFGRKKDEE
jgi:hypothetical protein